MFGAKQACQELVGSGSRLECGVKKIPEAGLEAARPRRQCILNPYMPTNFTALISLTRLSSLIGKLMVRWVSSEEGNLRAICGRFESLFETFGDIRRQRELVSKIKKTI